jgi:hypothetical protein
MDVLGAHRLKVLLQLPNGIDHLNHMAEGRRMPDLPLTVPVGRAVACRCAGHALEIAGECARLRPECRPSTAQ